jgi:hypothetical protein
MLSKFELLNPRKQKTATGEKEKLQPEQGHKDKQAIEEEP